ncbi:MAG: GNAT family N-acetyltransferase [Hirschia sp.]|nr:GNAT family N-acetyltransferase [Hirschia sp.]MBF19119.1 GNAT family N-acetyltransferase [Hirschia sp.]
MQVLKALVEISPLVAGPLLFMTGTFRLVSAALPGLSDRLESLSRWVPLSVIEASHLIGSVLGTLMLFVSVGVFRRLQGARPVAIVLLLFAAGFAWLHGSSLYESLYLLAIAFVFAVTRDAYWRKGRLSQFRPKPLAFGAIALAIILAGGAGLLAYDKIPYTDDLWWRFLLEGDVSRFLRASVLVVIIAACLIVWLSLQPHRPEKSEQLTPSQIAELFDQASVSRPITRLALTGDKRIFRSESGRSFLAFGVSGSAWIAMGGPVGDPAEFVDLVWQFRREADQNNAWVGLYSLEEGELGPVLEVGLDVRKIGETATIHLDSFSMDGSARSGLRQSLRKGDKSGLVFEFVEAADETFDWDALKQVSDEWLLNHGGSEKQFSLGRFDPEYLGRTPLALARLEGRIVAFVNLLADPVGKGLEVDLMRHAADAPPQTMEWLFIKTAIWGSENGWRELDLGMAPLSGLNNRRYAPLMSRLGALIFAHADAFYGFEGLKQFKSKFKPDWRPVYLAAPSGTGAAKALLAVALLTSGGWRAMLSPKSA